MSTNYMGTSPENTTLAPNPEHKAPQPCPRRRGGYISWDEFLALNPPDDVREDVALSVFGYEARYTEDILPQTWAFLRRHGGVGVVPGGSAR